MYGCWSIVGAQYLILVVESMSMGVCLAFVISLSFTIANTLVPQNRLETDHLIVIAFVSVTFLGYLVSIPCFCYGLIRKRPSWFIPYLVWRLILVLLTLGLGISLALLLPKRGLDQDWTYARVLPPIAFETAIGLIFFGFAYLGRKEFGKIKRRNIEAARRRIHENYANIYRSKGNSTYSLATAERVRNYVDTGGYYASPTPPYDSNPSFYVHLK